MKPRLYITSPSLPDTALRTIDEGDLERLRGWKNQHRRRFFHQDVIEPADQVKWYRAFCDRPDDWMFIVLTSGDVAGSIGYRVREGTIDVYNVIRDTDLPRGSPAMVNGMNLLLNYLVESYDLPIGGEVLSDNPTVEWSRKRGFRTVGIRRKGDLEYHVQELDLALMARLDVLVETQHLPRPSDTGEVR